METPDDIEALSEAVDKISRDAMESSDTSEAARKLYQQLLQDTGTDLAVNYYDTGYKAYRSGDYETAIENLTKAVSYDETNSEAPVSYTHLLLPTAAACPFRLHR